MRLYTSLGDWNFEWNISGQLGWLKQFRQITTGPIVRFFLKILKISISWVCNERKTLSLINFNVAPMKEKCSSGPISTCKLSTYWALAHLRIFQAAVDWCNNHVSAQEWGRPMLKFDKIIRKRSFEKVSALFVLGEF